MCNYLMPSEIPVILQMAVPETKWGIRALQRDQSGKGKVIFREVADNGRRKWFGLTFVIDFYWNTESNNYVFDYKAE